MAGGPAVLGGIAQHVAQDLLDVGLLGQDDRVGPRRVEPEVDRRPAAGLLLDHPFEDVTKTHRLADRIEDAPLRLAQDDEVADDPVEPPGLRRDVGKQLLPALVVARARPAG